MKKVLLILLTGSSMLIAQSDPLYISNITFTPNGRCDNPASTITATGAGGSPMADGTYTFTLTDENRIPLKTLIGKTVTFQDVAVRSLGYGLTIKDNANTLVEYALVFQASTSKSVSFTIDSLPLGTGPGCITLSVTNPGGTPVSFGIADSNATTVEPITVVKNQAPFSQTFSVFALKTLTLNVAMTGDCITAPLDADFSVGLPFPQGQGNALKSYIYNKNCSCTLLPGTVPVIL